MKVKVRTIDPVFATTAALQEILRKHAHDELRVKVSTEELYRIMGELARRREASGTPFKSTEEALAEFRKHYMPRVGERVLSEEERLQQHLVPPELTPSPQGRDCLGNGTWPGYECQCDECPHYLTCFPDQRDEP